MTLAVEMLHAFLMQVMHKDGIFRVLLLCAFQLVHSCFPVIYLQSDWVCVKNCQLIM